MLKNEVIVSSLFAAGIFALASSTASASLIALGGTSGLNGNFSSAPITSGNSYLQRFNSTSGSNSVAGLVQAVHFGDSLFLTLTDMVFSTDSATPVTLTVRIVQEYALPTNTASATASHQLNGNTAGAIGTARIVQPSMHNATVLPVLDTGAITTVGNFNAGSGAAIPVPLIGSVYTIDTTYTFTLNRGAAAGTASIVLPNSGVDQVSLIVPAPSVCAMMICGAGLVTRRRRI
jgi:hypothetical protein